ncbi:hypothetical protein MUO14_00255 [Halobacillus shinanisalinarum]|uniref:Lipoprotein n=1 Tax=Halobacillus shinanisalinarum TaxID=2932258 RepID=A0ABY4GZ55_9BACI|nr:hypothetical protein [Halobacillus shinanisalinarum]UOQ93476.1 hypothetical protein MUO14_00255 [Halobacillus shinanisalinarum]
MKKLYIIVIVALLNGCSALNDYSSIGEITAQSNDHEAMVGDIPSEFTITERRGGILHGYELIGVPNKYGILNVPITTKEPTNFYIYFWGEAKNFIKDDMNIIATHKETKEKLTNHDIDIKEQGGNIKTPIPEQAGLIPLNTKEKVRFVSEEPIAFAKTVLSFSKIGKWEVNIFKENRLYTSISIEAVSKEASLEKLYKGKGN